MSLRLALHLTGELDRGAGTPGCSVRAADTADAPDAAIRPALTAAAWRSDDFDFWAFDRRLDELAARDLALPVAVAAADAAEIAGQIATRAQRLAPRRNAASAGAWFDRVLDAHRALHDAARPLVRADLDHAIDAWQWSLRLDGDAPAAVQLALLFHDIERLASEAEARREHLAPDYQAFKDAHARAGARIAHAVLVRAGVAPELADEVAALVAVHERRGDAPAIRALNDADALSFFAFNSPGYLAYFGPDRTCAKVAYTLARMSAGARDQLAALRLPRLVRLELARLLHRDHRA